MQTSPHQPVPDSPRTLFGRADESATVDRLLTETREGHGRALVIRGEAGIGKTALLRHVVQSVNDLTVLFGTGIEPESELPFAGLHLVLRTVTDRIDGLGREHACALRCALGKATDGQRPADRYAAGLAATALLGSLAEQRPVLVAVDDAHWLDRASAETLLFAARRLDTGRVAFLFTAREGHAPTFPAPGLSALSLPGLDRSAVRALLAIHASDLSRHVLDQIVAESRGNPLAALELAADRRDGRTPGGYDAVSLPTHSRLRANFADRIAALPEHTKTFLLVAAADGTRDTGTVLAAAARLGASLSDLEIAERAELLVTTPDGLDFRHPLVRAAAYRNASLSERVAAHTALAEVLDTPDDADRRAWHLAAARTAPDERVAAALEHSAQHAKQRGGYTAVTAAYERAAALSPRLADRGRRLAAAAWAAADAGRPEHACALAHQATRQLTDPVERARASMIRAVLADDRGRGGESRRILLRETHAVASAAPDLAGRLLLWVADSARQEGDAGTARETAATAERLRLPGAWRVRTLAESTRGSAADRVRALRRLLTDPDMVPARCSDQPIALHDRTTLARWHLLVGDHATAHQQALDIVHDCRALAADGVLPSAFAVLARAQLGLGQHADAQATAAEGQRLADDIGQPRWASQLAAVRAHLAAVAGDEEQVTAFAAKAPREDAEGAANLLDLGLGRHDAVLERSTTADGPSLEALSRVPDLVEAAVRASRPDSLEHSERVRGQERTWRAARDYVEWAGHTGQQWAQATALRCLALLADDHDGDPAHLAHLAYLAGDIGDDLRHGAGHQPERLFSRAIELHRAQPGRPFEHARTELAFGEWLRRHRRRTQARSHLRTALSGFESIGARPWAERVAAELRASGGGHARGASDGHDAAERLTPQELRVVRLAASGLSNRDIGSRLFLSPRTVGYHLYKAYPKLGVSSRGQLAGLGLAAVPSAV